MRNTCGIRISGVRGNVSMSSSCAAHLSGHPLPPCVQMGLLQPPRAAPSSALSWQVGNPYPRLIYHLGRGRSAPPFPDLDVFPNVSHMYLTCIVNVSCVPCKLNRIHCILNVSQMYPECILNVGYMSLGKIHSMIINEVPDTNVS